MPAKNKSNKIEITRVYDAPVKIVWDAWTDPAKAAKWWGPRGFTLTTHSKELRAGGQWRYTMHGPDGTDYPNIATYHEVDQYQRLVYDHGATETTPPLFRVTVLFTEVKGGKGTKMQMTMAAPSPEEAEQLQIFIKKANGYSTWDRLAEYLTKEESGKEQFVINRAFDTSIDRMYEMWTNPELFCKWLSPAGFTMENLKKVAIQVGAKTMWKMTDGKMTMYAGAQYRELESPRKLVYTQQFFDERGNVSRHPMAPTWPETMLTTVTLSEEGPDRTRVTITWEPYGATTREELECFIAARTGMTMGWTGSFDKLEALLAG